MALSPKKKSGKRTYRKFRKGIKKTAGKRSQNTKVNAKLTTIVPVQLMIGPGTTTNNYCLGYITALNASTSVTVPWYNNPDYLQQKSLYDEVKILGYTVKCKPVVTTVTKSDQIGLAQTLQNTVDPQLYTWFDRDGSTLTAMSTNVPNKICDYDSAKVFSCYRKWSRRVKVRGIWLDTGIVGNTNSALNSVMLTQAGLTGVLGIYGQNLPWGTVGATQNEMFAMLEVHYHMVFRGKKPLGFSVDNDGVITLTPSDKFTPYLPTCIPMQISDISPVPVTNDPVTGDVIYITP